MSKRRRNRAIRSSIRVSQRPLGGAVRGDSGNGHLSHFRSLTQPQNYGKIVFRKRKYKISSLEGDAIARNLSPFFSTNQTFTLTNDFNRDICRSRKERREVLFAKGRAGGNHKPPTYTIQSLVRC